MSRTRRFARSGAAALAVVAALVPVSDAAAVLIRGVVYMAPLAKASTAPVVARRRAQSGVAETV